MRYGKGERIVPLWPELRVELDDLSTLVEPGVSRPSNAYVIQRYRDSEANLRTTFNKIVEQAGSVASPKPFMALRASRRTELERQGFKNHVLNDWFGHSGVVAETYYLQTTEADFAEAIQALSLGGQSEGLSQGQPETPGAVAKRKNPGETEVLMAACGYGYSQKYTPLDSNQ